MRSYKIKNYLPTSRVPRLIMGAFLVWVAVSFVLNQKIWPDDCCAYTFETSFYPQRTLPQPYSVTSVVWSPDGRYLSVGSLFEENINTYDTSNWKIVGKIRRDRPAGEGNSVIQFMNDSKSLIVPRIKEGGIWGFLPNNWNVSLQQWNISNNSVSQNFPAVFYYERADPYGEEEKDSEARATAVSSDGTLVAASVGAGPNAHVLVYRSSDARILHDILCQRYNTPLSLAFSRDNQNLAVGGCTLNRVSIYDVQSGHLLSEMVTDEVSSLYMFISYNQTGNLMAVVSTGLGHGIVDILDPSNGRIVFSLPQVDAEITNLQWIDHDHVLVSYDGWNPDGSIAKIWDIRTGKILGKFYGSHLQIASINPDATLLAAVIGKDVIIVHI